MAIPRLVAWSAIALVAPTLASYAGPCTPQIQQLEIRINALLEARAASGPAATESRGALSHRQPTPSSVAAAEEKLGDLPAEQVAAIDQAMDRARTADATGDQSACEQALVDAQNALPKP